MIKKLTLILFSVILACFFITLIVFVIIGFKIIKPTKYDINVGLLTIFGQIINIPPGTAVVDATFKKTSLSWKVDTGDKEKARISFEFTPAFTRGEDNIEASIKMPDSDDPAIFKKAFRSVISDEQLFEAANAVSKSSRKIVNLPTIGETEVSASTDSSGRITAINWKFKKTQLSQKIQEKYSKLSVYPGWLLRFMSGLNDYISDILRGD